MRWGKRNYLSMTYYLSNKYTKNYCNRTILVEVIAEDVVAHFFFKHGVYTLKEQEEKNKYKFLPTDKMKEGDVSCV